MNLTKSPLQHPPGILARRSSLCLLIWLLLTSSYCLWAVPSVSAGDAVVSIRYQDQEGQAPDADLLAQMQARALIREGEPFSAYQLRRSLEAWYQLGQFVQIRVEDEQAPEGMRLKVTVEYKTRIRDLQFSGNQVIKQKALLAAMHFTPGGEYVAASVAREEERLRRLYRDRGFFQAEVQIVATPIATREVVLTVSTSEGKPTRIAEITFRGARAFSPDDLRKIIRIRQGDVYETARINAGIKQLERFYREHQYLMVTIKDTGPTSYDPRTNRVPVQIEIDEGEKLVLRIEGNRRISTKQIRKQLSILSGRYRYTDYTVRRSALDIKRLYQQRGYAQVTVESHVEHTQNREIRVYFLVQEGDRFTVTGIDFEGNRSFSAHRLLAEMRTRRKHRLALPGLRWLFSRGIFDADTFRTDLRALELFYKQQGFREIQIAHREQYDQERARVAISIQITEGPRTIVRHLTVVGNQAIPTSELMKGLRLKVQEPLSEDAVRTDRLWIENRYQKQGYIRCTVTPKIAGGDVTYEVSEGPKALLGTLHIRGNQRTKEEVIYREFRLSEGDTYNAEEIAATRQRLFGLGLFRDVDFRPLLHHETPETVTIDLDVRVDERPAGSINLRGGYSPSEQIRGTLELTHRNLYGRGRRLGGVLRLGTGGNLYEVRFVEPWLFHTRTRTSVRLFRDRREELDNLLATGSTLTISRQLRIEPNAPDLTFQYRYEQLDHPQQRDILVSSIGSSIQRDTRNDPLDPTEGSYHQFSVEYAGGRLGGNSNFIKLKTDHRFYFVQEDAVFALAARVGFGEGLRSTKEIAAAERFHAGGAYTLRGFDQFSLGEKDATGNFSGDVMLILNAELRFPIQGILGGSFFLDAGNIWGDLQDLKPFKLRSNVGIGLRLTTPIGPARIDYGFPLVRRTTGGVPGKLWFVLGHAF